MPWTTPGGTPCCCFSCASAFDASYWSQGSSIGRGLSAQSQASLFSISSQLALELYSGGVFSLNLASGNITMLARNSSSANQFEFSGSVSGTRAIVNPGGCVGAANSSSSSVGSDITGGTATGTATTTDPSGRPVGSDSTSCSSRIELSYQLTSPSSGVYEMFVGLDAGVATGFFRIPQTAPGVTFQGSGSGTARSRLAGSSGIAVNFVGVSVPSNGIVYGFDGNYGIDLVASASVTINASITHTPTAP